MAIQVGRMVAVLAAQTAAFEARMDAASRQRERWNSATVTASRGPALLRPGFHQLAFEAAGLSGPVGKFTQGLLTLGGGSGPALLAAGAIGALATAYDLATRSTRQAREEQEKFIATLRQVGPHAEATAGRIRVGVLQGQQAEPQTLGEVGSQFLSDLTGGLLGTSREEQKERIARSIAAETTAIARAENAAAKAAEKHTDALARAADEARRLKLEAIQFLQTQIQLERGGVFRALPIRFTAPAFGTSGVPQTGGPTTFQSIRRNEPRFVPDPFPPQQPRFQFSPEVGQLLLMSLMAAGQGGVSGAFGALGGLAGSLAHMPGLAGAAGPLGWAGFGL